MAACQGKTAEHRTYYDKVTNDHQHGAVLYSNSLSHGRIAGAFNAAIRAVGK